MDAFYFVIIIFILILAVFDLFAGVSNDAANFLNSAIGSKAASFKTVLIITSIGVFVGAVLSNGMMEIARHGIFKPEGFVFHDIICILLAAMITDVFLLDMFNTMGLPTSTTVSLVFELLGATVAIAMISIIRDTSGLLTYNTLINTEKALSVVLGIFLSVGIAFIFGALIQFLARLLFTFNYKKNLKYFGALFGGLAITCIAYFMLIKGLKDASFMTTDVMAYINNNTGKILLICFAISTVLMQILYFFKVNILKSIVLTGTFALACAFAGNDLVNFIGVPLAALSAFGNYKAYGGGNIDISLYMDSLNGPAQTPIYFLLIAGGIMVIALITSKKAQSVIQTSVNLSRQDEGEENFSSSSVARNIVRGGQKLANWVDSKTPEKVSRWIDKQLSRVSIDKEEDAAFDLLRAAINLIVAGLLIAMGTSLKLPLSTTYVTFMVAMGTSLSDRAWGRDSAVYRISGVLNVIGGWLITAVAAFMLAFIVAIIIYYGKGVAIVILIGLVLYSLILTQKKFKKNTKEKKRDETMTKLLKTTNTDEALTLLQEHSRNDNTSVLDFVKTNYWETVDSFCREDLRSLRKINSAVQQKKEDIKNIIRMGTLGIRKLSDISAIERGLYYYQCNDFMSEMAYSLNRIVIPAEEHIDNNFNPLNDEQKEEILTIAFAITTYIDQCIIMIESNDYTNLPKLVTTHNQLSMDLNKIKASQLKRLKNQDISTKASMIYLTIIHESKNIVTFCNNLTKVSRKFQIPERGDLTMDFSGTVVS
jgi:phosphate/sulfate permease